MFTIPITPTPEIKELILKQQDYFYKRFMTAKGRDLEKTLDCLEVIGKIKTQKALNSFELIRVLGQLDHPQAIQELFKFLREELKKEGLYLNDNGFAYSVSPFEITDLSPEAVIKTIFNNSPKKRGD